MATLGYFDGATPVITADILGVVNSATQELEGDIIWNDYAYEDSTESGGKTIQLYGQAQDSAPVTYRLIVDRVGDDIVTAEDEAPNVMTCTTLLDCSRCGISVAGNCYCKVPTGNAQCGFCEERNFTFMDISGGFSNYCNARF